MGRRWTSGIMLALGRGATRFSEIEAVVEGLAARMLALRLRELEHRHLVERTVAPTTPVSVTYTLTPRGQELLTMLHGLAVWGERWESGR
ncbi:helix-turn-helix transcriptional regulator [Kineosporia sp. J2-2]|uniref:Helix-turn-helix transcriptional regulator n=1 Tax=Kineosporia corallincola TaxID=2835133 RepID=A0ABS5TFR1_9ACTN|nr:helix-turn-helix domain-containing protein [Kineosporia corallincola]MBT0769920.1 helix-turn-helix transcriptional regulator [Kineosporia corallincola]